MLAYRKILLILLSAMLPLFCAACAEEAQIYSLPPTQEELEGLLAQYDLGWQVDDVSSPTEGRMFFSLRDADNNPISSCGVNCIIRDGERGVNISLSLPRDYDAEQVHQFFEEEWPRWCEVAAEIYGYRREAAKIYKEFAALAHDKDAATDRTVNLTKQVGENNYRLDMWRHGTVSSEYRIYGIQILNTSAQRHTVLFNVLYNMAQVGNSGVPGEPKLVIEVPDYSPAFTVDAYEKFAASDLPLLWQNAVASINPRELELEPSDNVRDKQTKKFSLTVMYYADEATVYGEVGFTENNLISEFTITDDRELRALLK